MQVSATDIINKVCKWRAVFAGWQLGTHALNDPECQAVRDHREVTILLRAEVNALTAMLVKKGIFTASEFTAQVAQECEFLDKQFERRFPGFKSTADGMELTMPEAGNTTRHWRP